MAQPLRPPPRGPRGTVPIPQTVPSEAHSLWAGVLVRHIDSVLAAVDRGHREGVDSLLALPAEVLPDQQAGQGRPCHVQLRLESRTQRAPGVRLRHQVPF